MTGIEALDSEQSRMAPFHVKHGRPENGLLITLMTLMVVHSIGLRLMDA